LSRAALIQEAFTSDDQANADEGADPTNDIKKQNPEGTTTGDLAGQFTAKDVDEDDPHKVEKLTKAGRDDFDPGAGQE
jgi:hypothetical protein